jgi:hypothetical protein
MPGVILNPEKRMSRPQIQTRSDLKDLALELLQAVGRKEAPEGAGYDLGPTRAFYGEAATRLETFSRTLWAAVPLCMQGEWDPEPILRGLEAGTDPEHPGFWGWAGPGDSRLVEMCAIAFALKMAPDIFWAGLSAETQGRVADWLGRINDCDFGTNNWLYFRVFVNEALREVGAAHRPEQVEADLEGIEGLYLGEGWYGDGPIGTVDYYNAFAFHFYGLLYAQWAKNRDPERARRFRERAALFQQGFLAWWDPNGAAIPYGRSLVYRFGMAATWAAVGVVELPGADPGVAKGMLLRHLRWWFARPIRDAEGLLNLGFAYSNQNMVEMYNAPGSPMWAMKAFLPLMLPEDHAFWQAEEKAMPAGTSEPVKMPDGKKVLGRGTDGHAWMLSAGHNLPWQGRAFADKYSRFVYSSRFGFSVSVEDSCVEGMAPDSTLVVSVDGKRWFGRREVEGHRSGPDWVESRWSPCPGVRITTRLQITAEGHLRRHELVTEHPLEVVEGGFAVPRPVETPDRMDLNPVQDYQEDCRAGKAEIRQGDWVSVIEAPEGDGREGEMLRPWATTHLLFPATLIPLLRGRYAAGTHRLECRVTGTAPCCSG